MINIILAILAATGSLASYTIYILSKVKGAAAGAISDSEQEGKTGEEKFRNSVDNIYAIVPAPLRTFVPRNVIEAIIQATFDKVEEYAKKQRVNKKQQKQPEK